MWRLHLLRVMYYSFFALIFLVSLALFLRLIDFYFFIPALKNFLADLIESIKL